MTENIARGSIKARRVDAVKLIAMNHKTLRIVSVLECILGSILVSIRPDASPTPAAKAKANAKAKPESIVYTRASSAKNMGDGGAAPTPKERGQSLDWRRCQLQRLRAQEGNEQKLRDQARERKRPKQKQRKKQSLRVQATCPMPRICG